MTKTQNTAGEEVVAWSTFATVWAQKREDSSSERFVSAQLVGKSIVVFRFRYSDQVKAVTTLNRIICDGRVYLIEGGPREIGRREGLEVDCTVRTEDPVVNV